MFSQHEAFIDHPFLRIDNLQIMMLFLENYVLAARFYRNCCFKILLSLITLFALILFCVDNAGIRLCIDLLFDSQVSRVVVVYQ